MAGKTNMFRLCILIVASLGWGLWSECGDACTVWGHANLEVLCILFRARNYLIPTCVHAVQTVSD